MISQRKISQNFHTKNLFQWRRKMENFWSSRRFHVTQTIIKRLENLSSLFSFLHDSSSFDRIRDCNCVRERKNPVGDAVVVGRSYCGWCLTNSNWFTERFCCKAVSVKISKFFSKIKLLWSSEAVLTMKTRIEIWRFSIYYQRAYGKIKSTSIFYIINHRMISRVENVRVSWWSIASFW